MCSCHLVLQAWPSGLLQVGETGKDWFCIYLIPETLSITTMGRRQEGDVLNLEIEAQTQAGAVSPSAKLAILIQDVFARREGRVGRSALRFDCWSAATYSTPWRCAGDPCDKTFAWLVNLDSLSAHLEAIISACTPASFFLPYLYCAGSLIALCMHGGLTLLRLECNVRSAAQACHEATPSHCNPHPNKAKTLEPSNTPVELASMSGPDGGCLPFQ